jgi:hypothetical protein
MAPNDRRSVDGLMREAKLLRLEADATRGSERDELLRRARLKLREAGQRLESERGFAQFVSEARAANNGRLPSMVERLIDERRGDKTTVRDMRFLGGGGDLPPAA